MCALRQVKCNQVNIIRTKVRSNADMNVKYLAKGYSSVWNWHFQTENVFSILNVLKYFSMEVLSFFSFVESSNFVFFYLWNCFCLEEKRKCIVTMKFDGKKAMSKNGTAFLLKKSTWQTNNKHRKNLHLSSLNESERMEITGYLLREREPMS